jgi:hypothetical protein
MLYSGLTNFRYSCQKTVIDSFVYLLLIVVRQRNQPLARTGLLSKLWRGMIL